MYDDADSITFHFKTKLIPKQFTIKFHQSRSPCSDVMKQALSSLKFFFSCLNNYFISANFVAPLATEFTVGSFYQLLPLVKSFEGENEEDRM